MKVNDAVRFTFKCSIIHNRNVVSFIAEDIPKRAKIIDSDNEEDNVNELGKNQTEQQQGGESSDEGINRNEGDKGFVRNIISS